MKRLKDMTDKELETELSLILEEIQGRELYCDERYQTLFLESFMAVMCIAGVAVIIAGVI